MKKIWLDTDIGSDIDDALALAFLLARGDCELVGISTTTEVGLERAQLASALCRVAGKSVPIFPGATRPLLVAPRQTEVPQRIALERWPHDEAFPDLPAALALRDAIRRHPGEITLLAIGPMTNLAAAFALDEELPALLGELVLMCGVFQIREGENGREWNASLDPHATEMTYRACAPRHFSVGLDVTTQVTMEREAFLAACAGHELLRCVTDLAAAWFGHTPRVTFHDPLAAATLFDRQICREARGRVEIETQSEKLGGYASWQRDASGPHLIAVEVDAARFFEAFFGVFES